MQVVKQDSEARQIRITDLERRVTRQERHLANVDENPSQAQSRLSKGFMVEVYELEEMLVVVSISAGPSNSLPSAEVRSGGASQMALKNSIVVLESRLLVSSSKLSRAAMPSCFVSSLFSFCHNMWQLFFAFTANFFLCSLISIHCCINVMLIAVNPQINKFLSSLRSFPIRNDGDQRKRLVLLNSLCQVVIVNISEILRCLLQRVVMASKPKEGESSLRRVLLVHGLFVVASDTEKAINLLR
ncbi:uncharacterized protein G2W53_017601 [Senna tora]|uniref:Uncharacterized protein n=1 Tax=Senna tora TaxID=362788 RepID=A0A834TS78_9FABA|nr:uncharacterized protein G2W53_017601 [Senna tora]